jgi:tRNA(Ile)-lysidine synthase
VRSFIAAHEIFEPGPIVVACSGGPDSVALVGILNELAPELGLVLHVAHFDHRMRPTSGRDARLVQGIARDLGLPSHAGSAARAPRGEAEARDARYRFLRAIARQVGARAVALGHTLDDQAETVLLHLVRGSGLAGLAAMRPRRDDLARPLLSLRRSETAMYASSMGVKVARDPSNRDVRFARNLVRLRVMPLLERINPRAIEALARVADLTAALADAQRARAEEALAASSLLDGDAIDLDRLPEDRALRSEMLALAAERVGAGILSERQRRALLELSEGREGSASLDLPHDVVALREYGRLLLGARRRDEVAPEPQILAEGLETRWGGWTFYVGGADQHERGALPLQAQVTASPQFRVRTWRAGDRLAGGKKVQDLLTDAKVPRRARSTYPVIVTQKGDVVWVPGIASTTALEDGETEVRLSARPPSSRAGMTFDGFGVTKEEPHPRAGGESRGTAS